MDQTGGDIWRGNVGMRVLQINSVCGYGSTGNIVVDLYHELKKQGHGCCIAYGRGTAPDDVDSYRIGTDLDVYVHGVMSRLTDKHGFYSTHATKKFVKWMKEYDPDVIHLHNLHGYYINIEVLFEALKQMDKPVVWTLHDCWAFTGHCSHYTTVNCDKWITECEHCRQKNSYPTSIYKDNSSWNYSKKKQIFNSISKLIIVTPSQWLMGEVKKSFLSGHAREVIYNGIDLQTFCPTESTFREQYHIEDKKIILGVANVWTERKGLGVFNSLADQLDDSYVIVLVGLDKKQCTKQNPHSICIGRTRDKRELAEIYTAADIYLNPSVEETMGLTTVEALACGTNVLVRNSTALPEIVKYDESRIMTDDDLRGQIGNSLNCNISFEANRELAMQYEKAKQYQKYVELYRKMGL